MNRELTTRQRNRVDGKGVAGSAPIDINKGKKAEDVYGQHGQGKPYESKALANIVQDWKNRQPLSWETKK